MAKAARAGKPRAERKHLLLALSPLLKGAVEAAAPRAGSQRAVIVRAIEYALGVQARAAGERARLNAFAGRRGLSWEENEAELTWMLMDLGLAADEGQKRGKR